MRADLPLLQSCVGYMRGTDNLIHFLMRRPSIERERSRKNSDQNQHDQAHTLLAIIRAMSKTDAGTGEHQQTANPRWWWFSTLGRFEKFRSLHERFHQ